MIWLVSEWCLDKVGWYRVQEENPMMGPSEERHVQSLWVMVRGN